MTAVVPFFSYAKGDKKDEPRVSIRARVCADMIEAAGADRVLTMDLHSPQIQGFFRIPVDQLVASPILCEHLKTGDLTDTVLVAGDVGEAKEFAEAMAKESGGPGWDQMLETLFPHPPQQEEPDPEPQPVREPEPVAA